MKLLLLMLLLVGCETKTYVNEKYKFSCEKIETQDHPLIHTEVVRCENFEVICYNTSVLVLLFPAITSQCFEKLHE